MFWQKVWHKAVEPCSTLLSTPCWRLSNWTRLFSQSRRLWTVPVRSFGRFNSGAVRQNSNASRKNFKAALTPVFPKADYYAFLSPKNIPKVISRTGVFFYFFKQNTQGLNCWLSALELTGNANKFLPAADQSHEENHLGFFFTLPWNPHHPSRFKIKRKLHFQRKDKNDSLHACHTSPYNHHIILLPTSSIIMQSAHIKHEIYH